MVQTSVRFIDDGPRNCVVVLDGYIPSQESENYITKVDISTLSSWGGKSVTGLILLREEFSTSNVEAILYWEGAPDLAISMYPADFSDTIDHMRYGGTTNNATAPTGNVLLSTNNFTDPSLDGRYTITLWFRKLYADHARLSTQAIPNNAMLDELGSVWVDELGNIMVAA